MADQKLTERTALITSSDAAFVHVVDGGLSYKQTKANFLKEDRAAYVDKTSSQTITGAKTFSTGIQIDQFTPLDVGLEMLNGTSGPSIKVTSVSSGDAFVSNQSSTGRAFVGKNAETETFTVNKEGDIIGNSFGTSDGIVKKTAKVTISAADIRNSNTTPVVLIASEGVDKVIMLNKGIYKLNYGTVAFDFSSAFGALYTSNSFSQLATTDSNLNSTSDQVTNLSMSDGAIGLNDALMFKMNSDATVGDSTVAFYLEYSVYTID